MRPQLRGEIWKECARCGSEWPMSYLSKNREGKLICNRCWDKSQGSPNDGDSK